MLIQVVSHSEFMISYDGPRSTCSQIWYQKLSRLHAYDISPDSTGQLVVVERVKGQ